MAANYTAAVPNPEGGRPRHRSDRRRSERHRSGRRRARGGRWFSGTTEGLLAATVVVAPLAIGTVQWWALALVVALALATATSALLDGASSRRWPLVRAMPWPVWVALGVALFVGAQALPLPFSLLRVLSPHAAEVIAFSTNATPAWHALSLDPSASAREFARLLAFAAVLFAASRVAVDAAAAWRLTRLVAGLMIVECLLVAFHAAVGGHTIYGVVPVTRPTLVLGSFGSGNHFAAYLTLGVPLMLACAQTGSDERERRPWWIAAAAVSVLVALTLSRSGIAGLVAATATYWWLTRRTRRGDGDELDGPQSERVSDRMLWALPVVVGAALLCGVSLALLGDAHRAERLGLLIHPTWLGREEKVAVWLDVPRIVRDYLGFGIGRGAFQEILPSYKLHADGMTFSYVESAPLQLLVDLGLFVGAAVIVAWVWGLWRATRRREGASRLTLQQAALAAALVGVSIHDLGDFSLDASGAVGVTAALLWGLSFPARRQSGEGAVSGALGKLATYAVPSAAFVVASLALVVGWRGDLDRDVAEVQARIDALDQARESTPDTTRFQALLAEAVARHPAEPWLHYAGGVALLRARQPGPALHHLNRAITLDPTAWRPHLAVAETLLAAGRRPQAMLELRLAYRNSDWNYQIPNFLVRIEPHTAAAWLTLGGDDPEVLAHLAESLDGGRHDELLEPVATRLLALRPSDPAARKSLARIALAASRFDEALAHAGPLPADAESTLLRVRALDGLGKSDDANHLIASALPRVLPADPAFALAERSLKLARPDLALVALDRLATDRLKPTDLARDHLLRSAAFEQQGRMHDAVQEAVAATRADPGERTRLALGSLYERNGMLRDAYVAYRGALRSARKPSEEARAALRRVQTALGIGMALDGLHIPEVTDIDDTLPSSE